MFRIEKSIETKQHFGIFFGINEEDEEDPTRYG